MEGIQFYIENGLSFFPIPYGKKESEIAWKPYQERKPTEKEVAAWFNNGHKHNVAVVTGYNNLVVLDCDTVDIFYELYQIIYEKTGLNLFDLTLISKTSRGFHIWLFVEELPPNQKFPKMDIKSIGGYVIAPPSMHPSGTEYQFVNYGVPILHIKNLNDIGIDTKQKSNNEPANQPGWVTELLKGVGEGQWNDTAIKLAGYFRNLLPVDVTEHILIDWNRKNKPPLPDREIQQVLKSAYGYKYNNSLRISPNSEATASERKESVKDSVNLSVKIEDWVKDTTGWFSYDDVDKEFNIKSESDKANRRMIFKKLRDNGTIETHQKNNKLFRHVNVAVRLVDFKSAGKRTPLTIKYPFGIENYFNTFPGNIIVLAGAADAGKTGFLLNVIKENQFDFSIFYQTSEMGKEELASRLEKFEDIELQDWNFQAEERSRDFSDVIRPDCINIIDYLELAGDFYSIADQLRAIHDRLQTGIAIVALQKKRNAELGRGGDFGLEKPRLYLAMDKGRITIQKAKNWVNPEENPNGLKLKFKIVSGCKFIVTEDWNKDSE